MSGPETATVDRHDEDVLTPEQERWLYPAARISRSLRSATRSGLGSGDGWSLRSPTTISASRLITTWRVRGGDARSLPGRARR